MRADQLTYRLRFYMAFDPILKITFPKVKVIGFFPYCKLFVDSHIICVRVSEKPIRPPLKQADIV